MMMNLTFYFIQFDLIWIFSQCSNTYKRFDNMLAAVGTLDSYDCIESHRRYQGHLRVAISMNCNSNRVMKLISMNSSQEDTIKKTRERMFKMRGQKKAHIVKHFCISCGNVEMCVQSRVILFYYFFCCSRLSSRGYFGGWAWARTSMEIWLGRETVTKSERETKRGRVGEHSPFLKLNTL